MRLGLQPDRGRIDVVISNWRRIKGRINVAWQSLHQVIVNASQGHRRISREEHYRAEVELLTHMSLLMLRRAELLLMQRWSLEPNINLLNINIQLLQLLN